MDLTKSDIGKEILEDHRADVKKRIEDRERNKAFIEPYELARKIMSYRLENAQQTGELATQPSIDEERNVWSQRFIMIGDNPTPEEETISLLIEVELAADKSLTDNYALSLVLSTKGEETKHLIALLAKPEADVEGNLKSNGLIEPQKPGVDVRPLNIDTTSLVLEVLREAGESIMIPPRSD